MPVTRPRNLLVLATAVLAAPACHSVAGMPSSFGAGDARSPRGTSLQEETSPANTRVSLNLIVSTVDGEGVDGAGAPVDIDDETMQAAMVRFQMYW